MIEKLFKIIIISAIVTSCMLMGIVAISHASIDSDLKDASIVIKDEVKIYRLDGQVVWTFWRLEEYLKYLKSLIEESEGK